MSTKKFILPDTDGDDYSVARFTEVLEKPYLATVKVGRFELILDGDLDVKFTHTIHGESFSGTMPLCSAIDFMEAMKILFHAGDNMGTPREMFEEVK